MSNGNDTVLPKPEDLPQTDATTVASATADVTAQLIDVDDIELTEAKAAALAEEAGGQGDGGIGAATREPTGQQQQQAAPKDQQQPAASAPPATDQVMIPKPRFDEVLGRATTAEQKAAYWQGVAEARATPGLAAPAAGGQQQQTQTAEPPDPLKAVRDEKRALAKRYDGGEISMEDYETQRDALDDKANAIREEQLLKRVPKAEAPAQGGSDPLYLETLTADLETRHPWVAVFDAVGDDHDWDLLKKRAIDNLSKRGVDPTKGDLGRYELRKEIASLADKLGPALVAERATAKGIALPGAQQSQGQQQQQQQAKPAAPIAQQRLEALAKAAAAPPDISALAGNGSGDPGGVPSEARIEQMSDEDIAALPVGVRNRLMGIQA